MRSLPSLWYVVIAIEVLAQHIRNSSEIEGIEIDENKEVILSHLAGYTAVVKKSIYFPLWYQANII